MAIIDNLDFTPTFRNNQIQSQYENFIFAQDPSIDVRGRQNTIGKDCYNVTVYGEGNTIGNGCYNVRLINCIDCRVGEAEDIDAAVTSTYTPVNGVTLINCQNLDISTSSITYIQNTIIYGNQLQERSSNFTANINFGWYYVNASGGAVTVTLPAYTDNPDKVWHIKKIDSSTNTVTISPTGSDVIDGAASQIITNQWDTIKVKSNNKTGYYIH